MYIYMESIMQIDRAYRNRTHTHTHTHTHRHTHTNAWPYQTEFLQTNPSPIAGCVIVHNEATVHLHSSAYHTKTTTNIVKELICAIEVEGVSKGGYCSTLRRVILNLCLNLQ